MEQYSEEIKRLLGSIYKDEITDIKPVGNHELKRHLVFKFTVKEDTFILKIYGIKGKFNRELESLKVLENGDLKVPKVINHGIYKNQEWIILEYIDGVILEDNLTNLNADIFYEVGDALGKIHGIKIFNYAMGWDKKIDKNNYKEKSIEKLNRRVEEIREQGLPEINLLDLAINKVLAKKDELFKVREFRLTHNDFEGRNILIEEDKVVGVIDFEQSYPGNYEEDLANLYYKYFIYNKEYEKYFLKGYERHMIISEDFYKKLDCYLMLMIIDHCSWSYEKANDYYKKNIEVLKKILKGKF